MADKQHSILSGTELHEPKSHTHDTLYMKRSAEDFSNEIAVKGSPGNTDHVLIEDAAAGLVKKWATLGSLPGGGSGSSTWLGLTDTIPINYNGHAGECPVVNAAQTGLDFATITDVDGGLFTDTYVDLKDVDGGAFV